MGKSTHCPPSEITASAETMKTTQNMIKVSPPSPGALTKAVQQLEHTV